MFCCEATWHILPILCWILPVLLHCLNSCAYNQKITHFWLNILLHFYCFFVGARKFFKYSSALVNKNPSYYFLGHSAVENEQFNIIICKMNCIIGRWFLLIEFAEKRHIEAAFSNSHVFQHRTHYISSFHTHLLQIVNNFLQLLKSFPFFLSYSGIFVISTLYETSLEIIKIELLSEAQHKQ